MPQRIPIGHWGLLDVLIEGDPIPPRLSAVEYLWKDDDHCWPVLLGTVGEGPNAPYVAVLPPDGAMLDPRSACSMEDLDGVVLAEPVVRLHCFACGDNFAGLYPDTGLPFFGKNLRRHRLQQGCPSCGADYVTSKISAIRLLGRS